MAGPGHACCSARSRTEDNRWPDLSDEALLDTLEDWLLPYLGQVRRLQDFQGLDLKAILHALLPWPLPLELERLAPERLAVPSGSSVAIDYSQDPPVLAVKLQEMFGCEETPTIAGGRVALQVHLLSPRRRPLQVTQDLAGFWRSGYQEVKREMKGRYPKHPWPDDPLQALATRHTKKRAGTQLMALARRSLASESLHQGRQLAPALPDRPDGLSRRRWWRLRAPRQSCWDQLETQEMNGGGLVFVVALQVFIGDGVDPLAALHLQPDLVLDADHACQLLRAFPGIVVLDHKGGFPVVAVGDQRVVGFQFLVDTGGLEDLFDTQHFLDLVFDGQLVLEIEPGVLAQWQLPGFLVGHDLGAEVGRCSAYSSSDHRSARDS